MILKKKISILLAILLLVSNTGVAFNIHFCADVVASVNLDFNLNSDDIEEDCCGVTEEQSHCCDNKIIKSDKKSDQILLKSISFESSAFVLNSKSAEFHQEIFLVSKNLITPNFCCNANAPPIYERNCQLVFYA